MQKPVWIVYAKRTPIGKFSGAFAKLPAPLIASPLVQSALEVLPIKKEQVEEIIMGQVLTAGVGQAPARQTAIFGGLSPSTCATTVNRVCGSGLKAVIHADQAIRLGQRDLILAGGQENMSLAPHLLPNSRLGYRFGSVEMKDHMQMDGLWDPYQNVPMGSCGEVCAEKYGFSRKEQDDFAIQSYLRAQKAWQEGLFTKEVLPIKIKDKKEEHIFAKDEGPFSIDLNKISTLKPAFQEGGTITAGNASSINDGAAILAIASDEFCNKHGLTPIAKILSYDSSAQEPMWFTTSPILSINRLLTKAGLRVQDIDLFEINEAFAVVAMAAIRELKLDSALVNVNGGAVSLGHPIGASGARILVTLLHALKEKNGKRGVASICIGGGEATSILVELVS